MKKLILLLTLTFFAMTAAGQGDWFVGGSIGIDHTKTRFSYSDINEKNTSFLFIPSINYMVSQKLAIGLGIGYEHQKEVWARNGYEAYMKTSIFSLSPTLTCFKQINSKFYYTPQFQIRVGFGNSKVDSRMAGSGADKEDIFLIRGTISPLSFEYRPSVAIGINFALGNLGYRYTEYKWEEYSTTKKVKENNFNFVINASAVVTFRYYF